MHWGCVCGGGVSGGRGGVLGWWEPCTEVKQMTPGLGTADSISRKLRDRTLKPIWEFGEGWWDRARLPGEGNI